MHLNELRALRDAYALKAAAALARSHPAMGIKRWESYVETVAHFPEAYEGAIELFAEEICDITDWASVTRFWRMAMRVWAAECDELAMQCTTWGRTDAKAKVT